MRFLSLSRSGDAHVRPDHHIVVNIELAKVIKSVVLIDENFAPDTDIASVGGVEWGNQ